MADSTGASAEAGSAVAGAGSTGVASAVVDSMEAALAVAGFMGVAPEAEDIVNSRSQGAPLRRGHHMIQKQPN